MSQKSDRPKKGKMSTLLRGEQRLAYWLLLPTLLILFAIAFYPLSTVFYYSFTNRVFASAQESQFIGLENYKNLLSMTIKELPPAIDEATGQVQVDADFWSLWSHTRVRPLDAIVKVDAYLRGCPVVPREFLHLVKSMLHGTTPHFPPDAVCVECKKNGNECVLERGDTCMGPITWGGCNSICVNNGYVCDGCRGTLPHANIDSHIALMREHNIKDEDIRSRYRLFLGAEPIGRGV